MKQRKYVQKQFDAFAHAYSADINRMGTCSQFCRNTVFLTLQINALNDCFVMKMFTGGSSPEGLSCAHRCTDVEQLFSGHCLAVWPAAFLFYTMFPRYCSAHFWYQVL